MGYNWASDYYAPIKLEPPQLTSYEVQFWSKEKEIVGSLTLNLTFSGYDCCGATSLYGYYRLSGQKIRFYVLEDDCKIARIIVIYARYDSSNNHYYVHAQILAPDGTVEAENDLIDCSTSECVLANFSITLSISIDSTLNITVQANTTVSAYTVLNSVSDNSYSINSGSKYTIIYTIERGSGTYDACISINGW